MCYGREMYGDVSLVEYEGDFYNGMRYGNGKLYNKKNELIYEGEWYMNNPLEIKSIRIEKELKEENFYFGLEEIVIGKNCDCDLNIFVLKGYHRLKSISIGKNSLSKIKELILDSKYYCICFSLFDLPKLEVFTTDDFSFHETTSLTLSSIF